jgi:hypothetical protein
MHINRVSVGSGLDALTITQWTVTSIVGLMELDDFVLRHVGGSEGEVSDRDSQANAHSEGRWRRESSGRWEAKSEGFSAK